MSRTCLRIGLNPLIFTLEKKEFFRNVVKIKVDVRCDSGNCVSLRLRKK